MDDSEDSSFADRTVEISAITSRTFELSAAFKKGPRGRYLALPMLGVLALVAWALRPPPAPEGPQRVRVEVGLEETALVFETAHEVLGGAEVRAADAGEDQPWSFIEGRRGRTHRVVLPLEAGRGYRARAVVGPHTSLDHAARAPGELRVRVEAREAEPLGEVEVTVTTDPPVLGSLHLALPGGREEVLLGGSPGALRTTLPPPPEDARVETARFEARGLDGARRSLEVALAYRGLFGRMRRFGEVGQAALGAFVEGLLAPARPTGPLGAPVARAAFSRPPRADWLAAVPELSPALEAVRPLFPRAFQAMRDDPRRLLAYHDLVARLASIDASFEADLDGPPALGLGACLEALSGGPPGPGVGPGTPLLARPAALFPVGNGMPPGFYGDALPFVTLEPFTVNPRRWYRVEVEAAGLNADRGVMLRMGPAEVLLRFGPTYQPGARQRGPDQPARYAARVPGAWLEGGGRVEAGFVTGGLFSEALTVQRLTLWGLPE